MSTGQASSGGNTITFTLVGSTLTGFPTAWRAALAAEVDTIADTFQRQAQAAYTGTRFAAGFTVASTWHSVTLVQTNPLFRVVEYPTKKHDIIAHDALYNWLVFKVDGHWVRTKRVHHTGTPGRNAIDPLFQQAAAAFGHALTNAGVQVLRAL